MTNVTASAYSPTVLEWYRANSIRYLLEESPYDGEIMTTSSYGREAEKRDEEVLVRLRFDKRLLRSGERALIPYAPDFQHLPRAERDRWLSNEIKDPDFLPPDEDSAYLKAIRQNVFGMFVDDEPSREQREGE